MTTVILAAGKSTRTCPLTMTKPKPLLEIANKTILEHNLEQLNGISEEAIIIVGYKADMIEKRIGKKFRKIKISYIKQKNQIGNADALKTLCGKIKNRFILMFGDNLYSRSDIKNLLKHKNAILACKLESVQDFGVIKSRKGVFFSVIEKPKNPISPSLVNSGCFVFSERIFDFLSKIKLSKRNEYEFTDAINLMAKKEKIKVVKVENYWLPITYPWDVLIANNFILENTIQQEKIAKRKTSQIEKGATINRKVKMGKHTIINSGSYIEGPVSIGDYCNIGPNCYIRGATSIGDYCHIGQSVEVKNSIIGSNVNIAHLSYIGDSVIGDNCNIGAGTITANLRHDKKNIKCMVKNSLKDTGCIKLGAFMGDNCKIGIHTSFYPGVKIDCGLSTLPGEIVKRDLKNIYKNK